MRKFTFKLNGLLLLREMRESEAATALRESISVQLRHEASLNLARNRMDEARARIELGDGARLHRWAGIIDLAIFVAESKGSAPARTIADSLRTIFQGKQLALNGGGSVRPKK